MSSHGIDFGTTNSVVARYDSRSGHVLAFRDRTSNRPHPSVVWYRGDKIEVGKEAKHQIREFAGVTGHAFISSVKRKLGKNHSFSIFGEKKPAYDVASEIFKYLRQQARASYEDDIENVVLTVPVYFDGQARSELRKAANLAGIEIKTFVHEPFAAVIGYYCGGGRNIEALDRSTILVFDWGGGTLDITIARIEKSQIYELATAGLNDIAGDHFDDRLEHFARSRFLDRSGFREDILALRPGTPARLISECERAKINLSDALADRIQVAQFFQRDSRQYDLDEPVTRDDLGKLISDDIHAALRQVDKAIDEASLSAEEIDLALLIGGSSRIPMLRTEMQNRFGGRTVEVPNADTIIAEGAAIVAANGWLPYLARPVQVHLADKSLYTVFESGWVLKPEVSRKEMNFYCTDNREGKARLVIVESMRPGDSSSVQNKQILTISVSANLPRPYNHERVSTRFEIDENLVLCVSAWSATQQAVARASVHDLCFGLRVG